MRLSFLLFALLQSFGFCHAAEPNPPWQAEWERTVQAAKKEGEVRLWGDQEITHPDIVAAFTKEYPFVRPVTVSGRVGELMPRIAALEAPFDPGTDSELARWMPRGAPVPPLALFRTIVKDPPLAQAMGELGRFLLGKGFALGVREREIVIDRTCALNRCEYEWGVHVRAFAQAAELTEEEWTTMIDINLSGAWRTCKAAIPHLIAGGRGGSIVITSSVAGLKGMQGIAHYDSAKHGLVGLMRTLALELAPHSIRVNSIHPTNVDTDMIQNEVTRRSFVPGSQTSGSS